MMRSVASKLVQRTMSQQQPLAAGAVQPSAGVPEAWQQCRDAALKLLSSHRISSATRASLLSTSLAARSSFSGPHIPTAAGGLPGSSLLKQHVSGLSSHPAAAAWFSSRAGQQASGRLRLSEMQQKKSGEQGLYIIAFVVAMVGVTYASVPLYRMFCQATGYGGTVQQGQTVEDKLRKQAVSKDESLAQAAAERELTVSFNADVSDGLPWKFVPCQRSVTLRAGQSTLVFYNAQNQGDKSITGVSTYNVAPQQAGQYFNKIQCFCFEEQRLRARENIDMPVFFYIDPEFALDPYMKNINHLTLSYTFFKVDDDDAAHEDDDDDSPTVVRTHECVEQA